MNTKIILLLIGMSVYPGVAKLLAHEYGDDFSDSATGAQSLSTAGVGQNGNIEVDTDEDWFFFHALPQVQYRITVATGTVYDTTLVFKAPDKNTSLNSNTTIFSGSPVVFQWTNSGGLAAFYLRVNGFAEFTTGSYVVAVSNMNFVDADGDGLLDSWETSVFGNTTNTPGNDNDGDGINNLQEYYLQSSPTNFSSGLVIAKISNTTSSTTVSWPGVQYVLYRVLSVSNLVGNANWQVLGTNYDMNASTLLNFLDPSGSITNQKFYRVEMLY